ncbi:hypothetical protein SLEP1_g26203 [Rubroshorea leprosula]|uniref:Reverse transcriptase domain-containing protein n=1 Tax=Rubroshorea leprosula TaxID=152421 RepID=A0AAV5JTE4_9ROSI|nr:hypothetical protein SLEP1_g26203 [Rubroshorea leprosula]
MVNTRSVRARSQASPPAWGQVQYLNNLSPYIPNLFPPVEHAEGGDENQPHNSALILNQARNNPGDPLINLLNPTQQPPIQQQKPQPVQHALALNESQGQSHVASAQQPLLDDVTRHLDSLEKMVAEQSGAPPPHHNTTLIPHPLNTNITLEPYPIGFKIPQLKTYDGTKDPNDQLHAFYSYMQAQNASYALRCKIFPSTLRGTCEALDNKLEDETRATSIEDVEEVKIDDRDPNRKIQIGTRYARDSNLGISTQAQHQSIEETSSPKANMVTIVFRAQIGKNLEVYVDNIVVKSREAKDHLADLNETFNNLRKNIMQLNPAKCTFGVESGKFLGFMVSKRGIKVNPKKIKAIAEIESPKLVKDVQRLTRRVATLHKFISKSVDKCLPFFKIMRSATQKDESGK